MLRHSVTKTGKDPDQARGPLPRIERLLRFAGIALLVTYIGVRSHSFVFSRVALWQFQTAHAASATHSAASQGTAPGETRVDFSLWSSKRIQAFRKIIALKLVPPIAVLNIPRLHLNAPVFEGTDDLTLNRGLGRIPGTGRPGEGNFGIAGHRDGFFRGLKDIEVGDRIEIATGSEVDIYIVERTEVVTPDDMSVLSRRPTAVLTLVTCYPFYFVGDAPRRFIVGAALEDRRLPEQQRALPSEFGPAKGPTIIEAIF